MTNWPTAPLIKVVRGRDLGELKENMIAARIDDSGNYMGARCVFAREVDRDSIDEWEDVTAVPTTALEELKKAWHGDGEYTPKGLKTLGDAMGPVLSCLPATKPSPLDRAVTRVKDLGGPMVDANSTQDDRLALLLDALASVQGAARKTAPLTMVARICVEWANVEEPYCDALREIAGRAESDPAQIGFVGLAAFAGDIAASLDDGANGGPRNDLLEMGHYALAWAAQTIEEEDK